MKNNIELMIKTNQLTKRFGPTVAVEKQDLEIKWEPGLLYTSS